MISVDQSYRHCDHIARNKARNFYYGFMLLPRERRMALSAMYAFFRECDDISDEPGPPEEKRRGLEAWRRTLDHALEGHVEGSLLFPAFRDAVMKYSIPPKYFHDLLDGTLMDLERDTYETFDDLYTYCYRVASTVGLVCLHIFGFDHTPEALQMGEWCGIAFQVTNILRDVEEDSRLGRIYLPQEDLRRFAVTPEELKAATPGHGFRSLMAFEAARAHDFYQKASALPTHIEPCSRSALCAMVSIYHRLLEKLEREDFHVFGRRVKLSKAEKLGLLARAFLRGRDSLALILPRAGSRPL